MLSNQKKAKFLWAFIIILIALICIPISGLAEWTIAVGEYGTWRVQESSDLYVASVTSFSSSNEAIAKITSQDYRWCQVRGVAPGTCRIYMDGIRKTRAGQWEYFSASISLTVTRSSAATSTPKPIVTPNPSPTPVPTPVPTSGKTGEIIWNFNTSTGLLSLTGSGAMPNYSADGSDLPWFGWRNEIRRISIGKGITSIGNHAFWGCFNLNEVIFMDQSVTSIGDAAFTGCKRLTSVTLPDNLTNIGFSAFSSTGIKKLQLPRTVQNLAEYAFAYCSDLISVEIGSTPASVGDLVFLGCTSLNSVVFPDDMQKIPDAMFVECTALENISWPTNMDTIGYRSFEGCNSIRSLSFPAQLRSVESKAFNGASQLQSLWFASDIKLGLAAFRDCSTLEEVYFGGSSCELGSYAFDRCSSLSQIYFPADVTLESFALCGTGLNQFIFQGKSLVIASGAFNETSIQTFEIYSDYIDLAASTVFEVDTLTKVVIHASSGEIESNAFNCSNIQIVEIAGQAKIGLNCFGSKCENVNTLIVGEGIKSVSTSYFPFKNLKTLYVPKSATSVFWISDNAPRVYYAGTYAQWTSMMKENARISADDILHKIIPEAINYINVVPTQTPMPMITPAPTQTPVPTPAPTATPVPIMVEGNIEYTDLTWSLNVEGTLSILGKGSMIGGSVSGLENYLDLVYNIEFSDGITGVGELPCLEHVEKVILPDSVTEVGFAAFEGWTSLRSIKMLSVTNIDSYAFAECGSLENVYLSDGLEKLAAYTFYRCFSLKSFVLPDTVEIIEDYVFERCDALEYIVLPAGLNVIGRFNFPSSTIEEYNKLKILYLGTEQQLASIQVDEYNGLVDRAICWGAHITLPEDTKEIGEEAFSNTQLTAVDCPVGIIRIENEAFANCQDLVAIRIPDTISHISSSAFEGCTKITILCSEDSYAACWAKDNGYSVFIID